MDEEVAKTTILLDGRRSIESRETGWKLKSSFSFLSLPLGNNEETVYDSYCDFLMVSKIIEILHLEDDVWSLHNPL